MATDTIRTICPANGSIIYDQSATPIDEARRIAKASEQAFLNYKTTSLKERKDVITKALSLIEEQKERLGYELTQQMGRPIAYSQKELETAQRRAEYLLSIADEALSDLPGQEELGFERYVSKEPVGPVLISFAWNFPYLILVNALIPALLAGNTVVLKPSPQTPLIGQRVVEIFSQAGLQQNVVQVIQSGSPQMLLDLVRIREFQLISFTGSTEVGLRIREAVAGRIVSLNLELGGNDPAYVRADADPKWVAAQLVDGAIFNSGQSCCSIERIYVHRDIHDTVVDEIQKELKKYVLGDPFDQFTNIGPVISHAAVKNVSEQITDALSKGATNRTPYNTSFLSTPKKGSYVAPCLLTNVNHSMRVMTSETFGPVIAVAAVDSDEEAIQLMNDSEYGLTASLWTKDIRAARKIIPRLDSGTVFVNRADYPSPDLAWTGWKNSGLGCTLGPRAFDAFLKLKSFHLKLEQS